MHNALHMPETVGKTYELGGPHIYSNKEVAEMVFNKINRIPEIKSFTFSQAQRWLSFVPHFRGLNRWLSLNELQETKIDLVVGKDALGIEDLYVRPVALPM
mmetsp:Transcript_14842/g.2477  ORF Transcript_14842/g.2477 Transcript_14842/m.2477 type:complete len:101 (+) Transcript_14842:693-995(+)